MLLLNYCCLYIWGPLTALGLLPVYCFTFGGLRLQGRV